MNSKKTAVWLTAIGAGIGVGAALYAGLVRPWHLRWGATDEEVEKLIRKTMLGNWRELGSRETTYLRAARSYPIGEARMSYRRSRAASHPATLKPSS